MCRHTEHIQTHRFLLQRRNGSTDSQVRWVPFQLDEEQPKLRDAYGRSPFGQRLLLARRLIESGVRFVTVADGGWDTHARNFERLGEAVPYIDQGIPQLLTDLEERGMLETTLICWFTDFGRTPQINLLAGRDHWPSAGFAIMAGAGIPGGSVVGATDKEGAGVIDNEYFGENLAARNMIGVVMAIDHIANFFIEPFFYLGF